MHFAGLRRHPARSIALHDHRPRADGWCRVTRCPNRNRVPAPHSPAFSLLILSGWVSPADTDANVAWTRELWEQTRPLTSSAVYVNYLGSEGDQRIRDAFGVNHDRLARVKRQYDPSNFFRLNQNIQPAPVDP